MKNNFWYWIMASCLLWALTSGLYLLSFPLDSQPTSRVIEQLKTSKIADKLCIHRRQNLVWLESGGKKHFLRGYENRLEELVTAAQLQHMEIDLTESCPANTFFWLTERISLIGPATSNMVCPP